MFCSGFNAKFKIFPFNILLCFRIPILIISLKFHTNTYFGEFKGRQFSLQANNNTLHINNNTNGAFTQKMAGIRDYFLSFRKGMELFGSCINTFINSVLLLIVYILGIGLTSIISKITGKKFLDTKLDKNAKSYWVDLNLSTQKINEYYRQF